MRFRRSADKHGVPRYSTWVVAMKGSVSGITTNSGEPGRWYVGFDDRGIELEVLTVLRGGQEWVIHSMPTSLRHRG